MRHASYLERRPLRILEKIWARGEKYLNRLTNSTFNPLYHLGVLAIFLLIVLAITGTYLTIFYRPGTERAYATVAGISATWLGSLMRSLHRYAADGLILVILLHALKMFFSDRFWGSRWLAWVSGWGLLVLLWVIGVMGYWLVWDQRAQWLTEYAIGLLKGPTAVAFLSPNVASQTFAFFVIVLFLHIFLSVFILLGLLLHELRLSRARLWAPRWLVIEAGIALMILALWQPASSALPADLSHMVGRIPLDGWYLGFLPLAEEWGTLPFWGVSSLVLAGLVALPWLMRGRSLGPAMVTEEMCTGCALCFQQCPYGAIEMHSQPDDARFDSLAVVNPDLCNGCGLCVGVCSVAGIELDGLSTDSVWEGLKRSLEEARTSGLSPVVAFACQRHVALGTLPTMEPEREVEPAALQPTLATASWGGGNPHPKTTPLVTCPLPCVGMVQPEWIHESFAEGADAVAILSCPADDCAFREGPHWLADRLGRYRSLLRKGVYWLEAAPGDQSAFAAFLRKMEDGEGKGERGKGKGEKGKWNPISNLQPLISNLHRLRPLAAGLVVLVLAFGLSIAVERPATATSSEQGKIRTVLIHSGKLKQTSGSLSPEVMAKLPEGISPDQVLGGERFPVGLRLEIDGKLVIERFYQPGGLRQEGQVYGLESWSLPPGSHQVRLWMMDDGANWRRAFSGTVEVKAGHVRTLTYDEEQAAFALR